MVALQKVLHLLPGVLQADRKARVGAVDVVVGSLLPSQFGAAVSCTPCQSCQTLNWIGRKLCRRCMSHLKYTSDLLAPPVVRQLVAVIKVQGKSESTDSVEAGNK